MVYCGKASQGCQSCRTRRIKCDKVRPECSQCIRAGKKCPGYRDQLSLMFRDESTKVMQKAHASWGISDPSGSPTAPSAPTASSASPTSSTSQRFSHSPQDSFSSSPVSGGSGISPVVATPLKRDPGEAVQPLTLYSPVESTLTEQGIKFYVERYLLGYPNEPKTADGLSEKVWFFQPSVQNVMAAVGLAGLSNLNGDEEMKRVARHKYVQALQHTGKVIQHPGPNLEVALRSVVMLALFEVVKGTHESTHSARAHIIGAGALIRSCLPVRTAPARGIRGLLQLCCSLFIPCLVNGVDLPPSFFDWMQASNEICTDEELPAANLVLLVSRFVNLSAYVRKYAFSDGRNNTANVIKQLLEIDGDMERWEAQRDGKWKVQVIKVEDFPPEAIFRGKYHIYEDMWTARTWSHYRWARILIQQMILEFVERYPMSSLGFISVTQQERMLANISRIAEDILQSSPCHYKDPRMSEEQRDKVLIQGGPSAGAVGVPVIVFHLKTAACAPGVSKEIWQWAVDLMDTIWADLGMLHARSLAEVSRAHQDTLEQEVAEGLLKREII